VNIGPGSATERDDTVAELAREPGTMVIIDVHDRASLRSVDLREQLPLGLVVVVEIAMEIEVIAREVREHRRGERHSVRSPEGERVRRDLHDGTRDARVDHRTEPLLQDRRVGGRSVGDLASRPGPILDRADEAYRLAGLLEEHLDHLRRRRLA
jgi:hypothetical protein